MGVCIASLPPISVPFDIKPGVCPNPLYPSLRGKLPAAILGFPGFDVNRVDPASVRLEGIAPLKYEYRDAAAPFVPFTGKSDCKKDCTTAGPDGYLDLVLYFDNQAVARAINPPPRVNRECRVLKMTGKLKAALGGTSIAGEDVVIILHEN
jgi:hypothetical protein